MRRKAQALDVRPGKDGPAIVSSASTSSPTSKWRLVQVAKYTPNMIAAPYDRLTRRSTPKISVKPTASSAYAAPAVSPSSVFWTRSASTWRRRSAAPDQAFAEPR
jgi:hypothetical protein